MTPIVFYDIIDSDNIVCISRGYMVMLVNCHQTSIINAIYLLKRRVRPHDAEIVAVEGERVKVFFVRYAVVVPVVGAKKWKV